MFPDRFGAWLRALRLEDGDDRALEDSQRDGPELDDPELDDPALVRVSPRPELGDFSTPAALRASGGARLPEARERAERIADRARELAEIESAGVTGPGFVNVRLTPRALAGIVAELRALSPAQPRPALRPTPSAAPRLAAIVDEYAWLTSLTAQARALDVVPALDDPAACGHPAERRLLCALAEAPRRGAQIPYLQGICALSRRTDPAATVLPIGDEPIRPDHHTSLAIVLATRAVLGAGLAGTMAA